MMLDSMSAQNIVIFRKKTYNTIVSNVALMPVFSGVCSACFNTYLLSKTNAMHELIDIVITHAQAMASNVRKQTAAIKNPDTVKVTSITERTNIKSVRPVD